MIDVDKLRKMASVETGRRYFDTSTPPISAVDSVLADKVASADQDLLRVASALSPEDPIGFYTKLGGTFGELTKEALPRSSLIGMSRPSATYDPTTGQTTLGVSQLGYVPSGPNVHPDVRKEILDMNRQIYADRVQAARPISAIPDLEVHRLPSIPDLEVPRLPSIPDLEVPRATAPTTSTAIIPHPSAATTGAANAEKGLLGRLADKGRETYGKVRGAVTSDTGKKVQKGMLAAAGGMGALAGGVAARKALAPPPPPTLAQTLGKHAPLLGLAGLGLGGGALLAHALKEDPPPPQKMASLGMLLKEAKPRWQRALETGEITPEDARRIVGRTDLPATYADIHQSLITTAPGASRASAAYDNQLRNVAATDTVKQMRREAKLLPYMPSVSTSGGHPLPLPEPNMSSGRVPANLAERFEEFAAKAKKPKPSVKLPPVKGMPIAATLGGVALGGLAALRKAAPAAIPAAAPVANSPSIPAMLGIGALGLGVGGLAARAARKAKPVEE